MISNKLNNQDNILSESQSALSYIFGINPSDKFINSFNKEKEGISLAYTDYSSCVVIDKACADYIYNHIANYYPGAFQNMCVEDPTVRANFEKNYSERYGLDVKSLPSDRNLNFNNFVLTKVSSPSKKDEYMMVFPSHLSGDSMKHVLTVLEGYLMSYGQAPEKVSQYTETAFEYFARQSQFFNGKSIQTLKQFVQQSKPRQCLMEMPKLITVIKDFCKTLLPRTNNSTKQTSKELVTRNIQHKMKL